jgi:hypothetical protein
MQANNTPFKPDHALILRLAVGAVFGATIAGLIHLTKGSSMSGMPDWAQIALSVLLLGAFVVWAGAGVMRRLNLAIWSLIAMALIAGIAWHRLAVGDQGGFNPFFFNLSFLIYPFLFVSHELVASADQSGKWITPYPVYNDEAWQRGVQLVLALVFTGLFWGILGLGALLLSLIGFHWFGDLLARPMIAFPLSGLALGASVHLGDSQPKLMAGVRALVLGVLSWLLPVLTLIGLLFAVSLCFSGLKPLWATKAASMTLLSACVGLVLLINAAYQAGGAERPVHVALKVAARVACGLLLVFSLLAAYSLHLRIQQYGLTPERVLAATGVFIAVLYGLGYACAAAWPKGRWLAGLEGVNISMALILAVTLLAVLTPLADPQRLSVDSQVARLANGRVTVEAFDWYLLEHNTGVYGRKALDQLAKTGKTQAIRDAAAKAKAGKDEPGGPVEIDLHFSPAHLHVVAPQGAALPADFLAQQNASDSHSSCIASADAGSQCHVALIDLDHDGTAEVLLLDGSELRIFNRDGDGWRNGTTLYLTNEETQDFAAGKIAAAKPKWDDLVVGDQRKTVGN